MHQSSNHSKFQRMRRRLDLFRQKKEEQSVSHPLRACLPFLCATGVLMTTVVTAASCTLCYRVDAQGQSLAFFHDVATYDAAVSQAETRASKILETQYSLNQDLSVRATLAPRTRLNPCPGSPAPSWRASRSWNTSTPSLWTAPWWAPRRTLRSSPRL